MSDAIVNINVNNVDNKKESNMSKLDKVLDASISIRKVTTGTGNGAKTTVATTHNIIASNNAGMKAYKEAFKTTYNRNKAIRSYLLEMAKQSDTK